jgi:hypothetical protein
VGFVVEKEQLFDIITIGAKEADRRILVDPLVAERLGFKLKSHIARATISKL